MGAVTPMWAQGRADFSERFAGPRFGVALSKRMRRVASGSGHYTRWRKSIVWTLFIGGVRARERNAVLFHLFSREPGAGFSSQYSCSVQVQRNTVYCILVFPLLTLRHASRLRPPAGP